MLHSAIQFVSRIQLGSAGPLSLVHWAVLTIDLNLEDTVAWRPADGKYLLKYFLGNGFLQTVQNTLNIFKTGGYQKVNETYYINYTHQENKKRKHKKCFAYAHYITCWESSNFAAARMIYITWYDQIILAFLMEEQCILLHLCIVWYPLLTHSKEINKGDGLLFALTEHEINVFLQVNLLFYLPGPTCLISLILLFATSQTGHYVFVCLCLCQYVCFVRCNLARGNGPFHQDICFRKTEEDQWSVDIKLAVACNWVEMFR